MPRSLSQRQPGQVDIVAGAFRSVLGGMLATTYSQGGKTNEVSRHDLLKLCQTHSRYLVLFPPSLCVSFQAKQRLIKILSFWAERGVYDSSDMNAFEQAMFSGEVPPDVHVGSSFLIASCHINQLIYILPS